MSGREALKAQLEQALLDSWAATAAEPGERGTTTNVHFVVERAVEVLMPFVVAELSKVEQERDDEWYARCRRERPPMIPLPSAVLDRLETLEQEESQALAAFSRLDSNTATPEEWKVAFDALHTARLALALLRHTTLLNTS